MLNKINPRLAGELNKKIREDEIQKVVVGAIIFMGDREVLLLERLPNEFKGNSIELPSGAVEVGEMIEYALCREVKEETNLDISDIGKYVGHFDYQTSSGEKVRQLNFVVSIYPGEVKVNPAEHMRFLFVNPESQEFRTLNISKETKEVVLNSM